MTDLSSGFDQNSSIKMGVIGLSEGNGHPYSWSAIFNGYDPAEMENCGFPVIPRYLEQQVWPQARLFGGRVTHVWTQDVKLSQQVARATRIPKVCDSLQQMAQEVDAVLLARDDGEQHLEMALPFLDAGLPIFIDKPLANDVASANKILKRQQYPGQVFSCSALLYSSDFALSHSQCEEIGEIRHLYAFTPKSWARYGMHIINCARRFIPSIASIRSHCTSHYGDATLVQVEWANGITMTLHALGQVASPIGIKIYGSKSSLELIFQDTFNAFKASLAAFIEGIRTHRPMIPEAEMLLAVEVLELGQPR